MRKPILLTLIGAALVLLLVASPASAGSGGIREAGISLYGNIDFDLDDVELYSAGLLVHAAWVLVESDGLRLDFRAEALFGVYWDYDDGTEVALVPGLRLYMGSGMLKPYVEAGIGPSVNTLDIEELGTDFNFLSYGGLGLRFSAGPNSWMEVGGRVRHISNMGMDEHNHGVTAGQIQVGYVWEF
jgi:hypothetical protein